MKGIAFCLGLPLYFVGMVFMVIGVIFCFVGFCSGLGGNFVSDTVSAILKEE